MTAVAGDGRSVADGGPADGWATPAEPTPPAAAAAPPSTDSGNPATPPLATVEAGDNDGDSTAPPPAPAAPALPGDPGADLLPQDYPPPALNTRYPAGTRQPLSPVRADLARGNKMAQSQSTGAFTNVSAYSFATLGGCMFSTKICLTAVAMPTRGAEDAAARHHQHRHRPQPHPDGAHRAGDNPQRRPAHRAPVGAGDPHGHDPVRIQGGNAQVRQEG